MTRPPKSPLQHSSQSQEEETQYTPIGLNDVRKVLDSKLVNTGVPGAIAGFGISRAFEGEWWQFGSLIGAAAVVWFLVKLGSKIAPKVERAIDQADQAFDRQVNRTMSTLTGFHQQYQEAMKAYCGAIEVEGFQDLPGLALQDVFVPLHIQSESSQLQEPGNREIWNFLPARQLKPEQFPHRRIVVLAAPGYGKTTLLRYLTFIYLTKPPDSTPRFIPVLLRLREIYTQIPALPASQTAGTETFLDLAQFINRHLEKPEYALKPSLEWFESKLNQGECLVMFDGLDEVPKAQRQIVRQWVDTQMKKYRKTQFILTSRPHGFELQVDEPSHIIQVDLKLKVLDFTPSQKQQFIQNWCKAFFWRIKWEPILRDSSRKPPEERISEAFASAKSDQEAKESADELWKHLVTTPALNDLAKNPLLITMIAATHYANPEPAKRRVELYDKICNLLLGTRPYTKKTPLTLTATQSKTVLQVLAWNLVQREVTQFTPDQGHGWIQETLARCTKTDFSPTQFLAEMLETTGLLVEKELGSYEFSHQTFQEYFAALHIKEKGQEDLLLENLINDRWQEVICFYAAVSDASRLITAILDSLDVCTPEQKAYALELANRCKNEGREVALETRDRLEAALLKPFQEDPQHVGVGHVELIGHLGIGASVTVIGAQAQLAGEVFLEQRFRQTISLSEQTSITNSYITKGEYQRFLLDQESGQFHSTAQVIRYSKDLNKPVIAMSWEDARWFCAWLATQTQLQSDDKVYRYRLPTNDELRQLKKQERNHPYAQVEKNLLIPWTDPSGELGNALLVVREQIPDRYRNLLNYLANASWREADQETHGLMLKAAGTKHSLVLEDIHNFPYEDLRLIDHLWIAFSGGKFGLSVQKQLWIEVGGKLDFWEDSYSADQAYEKMCARNGWRLNNKYIDYEDLMFDIAAPRGHLPFRFNCDIYETADYWPDPGPLAGYAAAFAVLFSNI